MDFLNNLDITSILYILFGAGGFVTGLVTIVTKGFDFLVKKNKARTEADLSISQQAQDMLDKQVDRNEDLSIRVSDLTKKLQEEITVRLDEKDRFLTENLKLKSSLSLLEKRIMDLEESLTRVITERNSLQKELLEAQTSAIELRRNFEREVDVLNTEIRSSNFYDKLINKVLQYLLENCKSSYATLWIFHNGRYAPDGSPLEFFSGVAEVSNGDVIIMSKYRNLPVQSFFPTVADFLGCKLITITNADEKYQAVAGAIRREGLSKILFYGIVSEGKLIGFVSTSWKIGIDCNECFDKLYDAEILCYHPLFIAAIKEKIKEIEAKK